jgi:hypothetical protein
MLDSAVSLDENEETLSVGLLSQTPSTRTVQTLTLPVPQGVLLKIRERIVQTR